MARIAIVSRLAVLPQSPLPAALALLLLALAAGGCRERAPAPALAVETVPAAGAPRAVEFDPPLGATDVDARRTSLAVRFDRPMDPQGWAWVIENPSTAPEVGESTWDASVTTNTVAVTLEPGRDYVLWVNSPQYPYFRDPQGVSAEPVRWTFSTRGATPAGGLTPVSAHRRTAPRVIELAPADGAVDVDPSLAVLRATFDRPMEASWSWVTEGGDSFPATTGAAYFEADGRTAALPVKLEPGRTYVIWLNSSQYRLFRDTEGEVAEPRRWSFTTRAAD